MAAAMCFNDFLRLCSIDSSYTGETHQRMTESSIPCFMEKETLFNFEQNGGIPVPSSGYNIPMKTPAATEDYSIPQQSINIAPDINSFLDFGAAPIACQLKLFMQNLELQSFLQKPLLPKFSQCSYLTWSISWPHLFKHFFDIPSEGLIKVISWEIQSYVPESFQDPDTFWELVNHTYHDTSIQLWDVTGISLVGHLFQYFDKETIEGVVQGIPIPDRLLLQQIGYENQVTTTIPLLADSWDGRFSYLIPHGFQLVLPCGEVLKHDDNRFLSDRRGRIWAIPHPNNHRVYIRIVFGGVDGFPSYDQAELSKMISSIAWSGNGDSGFSDSSTLVGTTYSDGADTLIDLDDRDIYGTINLEDDKPLYESLNLEDGKPLYELINLEDGKPLYELINLGDTYIKKSTDEQRDTIFPPVELIDQEKDTKESELAYCSDCPNLQQSGLRVKTSDRKRKRDCKEESSRGSEGVVKIQGVVLSNSRRAPNCFLLYRTWFSQQVRRDNPKMENIAISRSAAESWRKLPAPEKQAWIERAAVLRNIHKERYPNYVYAPRKPDAIKRRRQTTEKQLPLKKRVRISVEAPDGKSKLYKDPRDWDIFPAKKRKRSGEEEFGQYLGTKRKREQKETDSLREEIASMEMQKDTKVFESHRKSGFSSDLHRLPQDTPTKKVERWDLGQPETAKNPDQENKGSSNRGGSATKIT
ncbi:hypothetical protein H072_9576 [Dactylellina haptotyla CBS 200.50]|uniref:HMG box domain-containing protein n=1 Tax=Dactylellina haptotyla (strain CBS 200.50) TaxID=1284197 RepID=S8A218_DACHA|nr:hypothetical protein H072_9576 [Dactylellina haptotyla CBS 200.50]